MVVAIPVYDNGTIFPNASFAPHFAIYNVEKNAKSYLQTVHNPRAKLTPPLPECLSDATCECPEALAQDAEHMLSHYYLVEILHDCDVILAKAICTNTRRVLEYVGISVYKIPPIILEERHAINNFIVGQPDETKL
jgi:predicted Fe-Mo cluster-binding NifX family protein